MSQDIDFIRAAASAARHFVQGAEHDRNSENPRLDICREVYRSLHGNCFPEPGIEPDLLQTAEAIEDAMRDLVRDLKMRDTR